MSLVDDIYEASAPVAGRPQDELGLEVWDNVDYYVARALLISRRDRPSEFSTNQVYTREGRVFVGNEELEENSRNIYRLVEGGRKFTPWEVVCFWKKLRQCAPEFTRRYIQISEHLIWDRVTGEIVSPEDVRAAAEE